MNPYTQHHCEMATQPEAPLTETMLLAWRGFTPQEIASLVWLRQWYQSGGSDRAIIVRRLEFLRFLVQSGAIAL